MFQYQVKCVRPAADKILENGAGNSTFSSEVQSPQSKVKGPRSTCSILSVPNSNSGVQSSSNQRRFHSNMALLMRCKGSSPVTLREPKRVKGLPRAFAGHFHCLRQVSAALFSNDKHIKIIEGTLIPTSSDKQR